MVARKKQSRGQVLVLFVLFLLVLLWVVEVPDSIVAVIRWS